MGPQKYLDWRGTIHLDIRDLKVHFEVKMTLVNPGLTKS